MSKQAKRRQHRPSARGPAARPTFTPVPVRARHDGWGAARQATFLQILSETACVEEAAQAVGMSARSAYTLKARPDAASFRQAWEAALDFAVGRLGDAMLGRALHGEATPVFFRGEQVGERRRYDNRLGMWLLRMRQPERYGRWREGLEARRENPDGVAVVMDAAIGHAAADARADETGQPRAARRPVRTTAMADDPDVEAAMEEHRQQQDDARREADLARWRATLAERATTMLNAGYGDDVSYGDDVAGSS